MCGITGFIDRRGRLVPERMREVGLAMADRIRHRGPDRGGVWLDNEAGVVLAHRRLSIIDLSAAGDQPMVSACGRYVISFNGEIYNFQDVRARVEQEKPDLPWRGHSDTEVLLEAIATFGFEATLQLLVGMFAFALWDRRERRLLLARDRLGEKPLYFGTVGGIFYFTSELKALWAHPDWQGRVDPAAFHSALRVGYVWGSRSIYQGINKLPGGCWLEVDRNGLTHEPQPYWSLEHVAVEGAANPIKIDETEAINELERLLGASVRGQMVSDVPLGAFLSGGVDSPSVVALMQKHSAKPINTYTIGFDDPSIDEAGYARGIAKRLGTRHTELYVSLETLINSIPLLGQIYDEPFATASDVAQLCVSRLARSEVTVCLTGDGGDELFYGYRHYWQTAHYWKQLQALRGSLSGVAAQTLIRASGAANRLAQLAPASLGGLSARLHEKAAMLGGLISAQDELDVYLWVGNRRDATSFSSVSLDQRPDLREWVRGSPALRRFPISQQVMLYDMRTYLQDSILTKVDRCAMHVSLETRTPFLDHRVVEYCWRVPMSLKYRDGTSKFLLRRLLDRYLEPGLLNPKKKGFTFRVGEWLRNPKLRDWIESLLNPTELARDGLVDVPTVQRAWREHQSGVANHEAILWRLLMFRAHFANVQTTP